MQFLIRQFINEALELSRDAVRSCCVITAKLSLSLLHMEGGVVAQAFVAEPLAGAQDRRPVLHAGRVRQRVDPALSGLLRAAVWSAPATSTRRPANPPSGRFRVNTKAP